MNETSFLPLAAGQVMIQDGFWYHYQRLIGEKALPYQWEVLNDRVWGITKNHTVHNFLVAAGDVEGIFQGVPYQDTDLAKWLDAVGEWLGAHRDSALESTADQIIGMIARAQRADGYLDTYYQLSRPGEEWSDPQSHELYCFGHFIEAGVSYFEGTGKRVLLSVAEKLADHLLTKFGPEEGKLHGYFGHEIIEMALVRLYGATQRESYLALAEYLIRARGKRPEDFYQEKRYAGNAADYGAWGWGSPEAEVSSFEHITGHAVRAMYLYCGMADVAFCKKDPCLLAHCEALFKEVTGKHMYVTGGIGATAILEAFTYPYDLPNDTMYAETCGSIGLVFFGARLLKEKNNRLYADVMERALYNILPAAIAQDGQHYFYVNPLEMSPEACRKSPLKTHVKAQRQPWFQCACCPPNLARLIASLPRYMYTTGQGRINVHLYGSSEGRLCLDGHGVTLSQQTQYPWEGEIGVTVNIREQLSFALALRIPGWCRHYAIKVNGQAVSTPKGEDGYAVVNRCWNDGDTVNLSLHMQPELMQANVNLRQGAGRVAIQRGPVVYCLEQMDNGENLPDICLDKTSVLETFWAKDVEGFPGYMAITGKGSRSGAAAQHANALYFPLEAQREAVSLRFVPYFLWGQRQPGEMLIWVRS